jgi:predicted negative regulator of RcsB-dependent stress response
MWAYIKANWKTNLGALCAFLLSVPADVTAFQQWQAHQLVDWHFAAVSTLIAIIAAVAKDGSNHSTIAQVQKATVEKE